MSFDKRYISPVSHESMPPWYNITNAYDGNTATYAYASANGAGLVLINKADTYGSSIKFMVNTSAGDADLKVEIYHNGAWEIVHNGIASKNVWITKSIIASKPKLLEKLRFTKNSSIYELHLKEVLVHTVWSSPASYNDPGSEWVDEENAYDDNLATYATIDGMYYGPDYCLELMPPADFTGDSEALRFLAELLGGTFKIDIYNGSTWTNIYDGVGNASNWIVCQFTAQTVTKCRVYPYNDFYGMHVFEVDFCQEYPWEVSAKKHHGNLCNVLSDDSKAEL